MKRAISLRRIFFIFFILLIILFILIIIWFYLRIALPSNQRMSGGGFPCGGSTLHPPTCPSDYFCKYSTICDGCGGSCIKIPPPEQQHSLKAVSGDVLISSLDNQTMDIQLTANSTIGNVTEMMVWTNDSQIKKWQSYDSFIKLPVSENVFVKYRDNFNNESLIYTDTNIPKYGPRNTTQ